jgi:hypothetical protein
MKNVTLAMDERLLEQSREYAQKHHTTLNGLIRGLLRRTVGAQRRASWVDEFLKLARTSGGNSRGWKWNREEIYDRKVFR